MAQGAIKVLPSTSDYYYWHVSGRPLSVILSLQVVSRLEDEIRGCQAESRTELSGILLGKAISTLSVIVEEYAVAPTAEIRPEDGPDGVFENLIQQWLPGPHNDLIPVGFFRTHAAGWIELNDHDLMIARRLFSAPNNIILLIRPSQSRASTGAIFTWDAPGQISARSSYCEFPFNAGLLKNLQTNRNGSAGEIGKGTSQDPGPQVARKLIANPKFRGALALAGLLCIAGLIAFFGRQRGPAWQPGVSILETPQSGGIGLAVKRQQGDLNISWDRSSKLLVSGATGLLLITDGMSTKTKRLDENQLREGQVLYSPASRDVDVRLIVTRPDSKSWAESVQTMASDGEAQRLGTRSFLPADLPAPGALAASPRIPPDLSLNSRLTPANAAKPQAGDAQKVSSPTATEARKDGTRAFVPPSPRPNAESAQARIPVLAPPDLHTAVDRATAPLLPQAPAAIEPNSPAASKPPAPASDQKVTAPQLSSGSPNAPTERQAVPGIIRGNAESPGLATPQSYIPPKPTRRINPAISTRQLSGIIGTTAEDVTTVDVTVSVDTNGNVKKAVPESQKTVPMPLISAAVEAARQWRFESAKLNGTKIPSEIVLRFVFRR